MRIAVVGNTGYIAKYLLQMFSNEPEIQQVLCIGRKEAGNRYLDLNCPETFDYSILQDVDQVIFTAAVSGPDQCAAEYKSCWHINVEGTGYFIKKAIEHNCRALFFSSDAVYGNYSVGACTEESIVDANTPYGRMKMAIEKKFSNEPLFKAIRLSYVVSASDRFVSYCLKCLREGKRAEIYHPFYRNCILIEDVIQVINWLIKNWDVFPHKVLNVAGDELISRLRIADEINRIFGDRLQYEVISPPEGFFANRPKIAQMESIYLQEYSILKKVSFSEQFAKELGGIII